MNKMDIQATFSKIISETVCAILKEYEFKKLRSTLYLNAENIITIVDFQKSVNSTKNECIFTVNLGFLIKPICKFLARKYSIPPHISNCQWKERIGFLLEEKKDKWWHISCEGEVDNIVNEVAGGIKKFIPIIITHQELLSFISEWRTGKVQGITELGRLYDLLILSKYLGCQEEYLLASNQLHNCDPVDAKYYMDKLQFWPG
ncbi:hypothetical protein FACS189485_15760 [Spirochaetia bacterium]|nr:hypothetical protein FACS189485_15760 [Spirochaetia bacterium]